MSGMWIDLTDDTGMGLWVNPDNITYVKARQEGAIVYLIGGEFLNVRDHFAAVGTRIQEWIECTTKKI
jgi:hypothetical protein